MNRFVIGIVALLLLVSCSSKSKQTPSVPTAPPVEPTETREFWVQVERIDTPESIHLGEHLQVRFIGAVGPSGCHQFLRFESVVSASEVMIRAIGEEAVGVACSGAVTMFRGLVFSHVPLGPGKFRVRVEQPDGGFIDRVVEVVEPDQ